MTAHISDELVDAAVSRLQEGESREAILAAYPKEAIALSPLLQMAHNLEFIQPVEELSHEALVSDRNQFLAQVTELQLQAVSPNPFIRLKGWVTQTLSRTHPTSIESQKETRQMSALVLKVALVLMIAFGSVGGTIAAADGSLPDSPVYPLKLAMEQARLATNKNPEAQAEMHRVFAQERVQEMVQLVAKGETLDEPLLNRLQDHMQSSLRMAAKMPEEAMVAFLAKTQEMAQNQEQKLTQAQEQAQTQNQKRLLEGSGLMAQWGKEAAAGRLDPHLFRGRFGPGGLCEVEDCFGPFGDGEQKQQNQFGPGSPPCEGEDCVPPYGDGDKEQYQNQHGPGAPPCEGEDCQPPYGDGDQQQQQNQYGEGGPCEGEDCQPPYGDGEQNQQNQFGPGAPPCEGDDCEPPYGDGDQQQQQNQHGPGAPPCDGEDCAPPYGDGDQQQQQNQNQEQNTEQNQSQGDTQNQNQEQNGNSDNGQESGNSDDSSGSDNSGSSSDSGSSGSSGGSDDSGGSNSSGGSSGGNGKG